MQEQDVRDVVRTIRQALRRGESCELEYPDDVPPLRLVFVPIDEIRAVGDWTENTRVVASAFPKEMRAASLEDATLVAWLGVGSALLRLAGNGPAPPLSELRLAFPAASVSGLASLGRLLHLVCHDPLAVAAAEELREVPR